MGVLISKLRGKPSTKDLLEDLEKQIAELEEYKRSTEQQQKRVIGSLIFYSIVLYILSSTIFLFYYFPATTQERILYSIPLLFFPILLYFFKRFLQWYFVQKIKNNEEQLLELKKRRRSLLEYAMETETYKVVKELLERFDPEYHKMIFESKPAIEAPPSPVPIKGTFGEMELRRRSPPSKGSLPLATPGQTLTINNVAGPSHIPTLFPGKPPTNIAFPPAFFQRNGQQFVRTPLSSMPRPVLPRERSLVDRLVDYLVGDGPSNRYALICRQCQSHNGMALKEEFEFIAFRCCYCFHWNPPRSQQPPAPRLPLPAPSSSPKVTEPRSSVSEISSSSGEDTEVESLSDADGGETGTHSTCAEESVSRKSPTRDADSLSSESEIQANLEEDKSYTSLGQNEIQRTETF